MILADTNLIFEALRDRPHPRVVSWLDGQAGLRLAAPVLAELLLGVSLMPDGARKDRLGSAVRLVIRLRFPEDAIPSIRRRPRPMPRSSPEPGKQDV